LAPIISAEYGICRCDRKEDWKRVPRPEGRAQRLSYEIDSHARYSHGFPNCSSDLSHWTHWE
jgi:hypothetical protein